MTQECLDCKEKLSNFIPLAPNEIVNYSQWENNEKITIRSTVMEAFQKLESQIKPYLIHVYVKRKQAAYMNMLQTKANGENIVIHVDFSENASLKS